MTRQPQSSSARGMVFIVIASVLAAVLVLVGFYMASPGGGLEIPLQEGDEASLPTVADIQPYVGDLLIRTDGEPFEKSRFHDGRTRIVYDYIHPASEEHSGFTMHSELLTCVDDAQAAQAFKTQRDRYFSKYDEQQLTVVNEDFSPASEWAAFTLSLARQDGVEVGNLVVLRAGVRVLSLELVGRRLDPIELVEVMRSFSAGYAMQPDDPF